MIDAATIDAMVASGCTAEQIAAVVKASLDADAARAEALRAKAAERQRRSRENRARHAMSRDVTVTERDICDAPAPPPFPLVPPSPEPLSPLNPPNHPPEPPVDAPARGANPVIVLGKVLNPMHARRFADHCAEKGRRLSSGQAEAIVVELKRIADSGGSAVAAVDTAIANGWTTIRSDGREAVSSANGLGKPRASPGSAAGRTGSMLAALDRLTGQENGQQRADFSGGAAVVDLVPATSGQRLG